MATKDQLIASAQKNLEKGQIQKAIKDYQELLKLEPKVDQHKQKLGDLLCRANRKEEALVLYASLAKGYAERGFFTKAIAVYKQIQRIDPADTNTYLQLAELNRNLGLVGNAMAEYRSLLEFYEKRNMAAEVANILQRMVELEPQNVNLQLQFLLFLLKERQYDKAKNAILKACEGCGKSGTPDKSLKILQSILPHLPENNEFHAELAAQLITGGFFVDAIFFFNFLLKKSPQNPFFLEELATLYNKIDDAENEILILDQLLAVQPTGTVAERLIRRSIATGDYNRAFSVIEAHQSSLDDENHTLRIELYQELECHLPGDQRVRRAIVQLSGGEIPISASEEVLLSSSGDLSLEETSEVFFFADDEFQLDDLLSLHPRSNAAAALPREEEIVPEEEIVEEELTEVSIELLDEEMSFVDIETFVETADLNSSPDLIQDDAALLLIDIDYDFAESGFEEVEEEILELESMDEPGAEFVALEELLAAEMENPSPAKQLDLNIANDEVKSSVSAAPVAFFDLASELLDDGEFQATEGLTPGGEVKPCVAEIDHEETEAHYDLGIAYKEMGLLADAIGEFEKSMCDPKRLADSLTLIGICHGGKGAFADAERVFLTAIARPEVQESDKVGMQYELGLVYEVWGRFAAALSAFEAVAHSDPSFRNVGEKIESLRLHVTAGEGEATLDTPGAASPGKDRVSFV